MKTSKLFICIGIFCVCFLSTITAQDTLKIKENFSAQNIINTGKYKINVDRALPMGNKSVYLTSDYSIEIKNDSIFSYLPYFGRAYIVPYGGGKGLIFQEKITHYKKEVSKKGKIKISFTTKNEEDTYNYYLIIFNNGKTLLQINSINRQPISFEGYLVK